MKEYDIIILGAGAAGLMCAMTAGARGFKVCILEKSNKVGKKILMSGGGRCNFTNLHVTPKNFLSNNPHFCKSALRRYTPQDFIALVKKHRIPFHEKTQGQLFCDRSSKDIVNLLLKECDDVGVEIITHCETSKIQNQFELMTNKGQFQARNLIVSTGALSIPTLGGSGFGYDIATQWGLNVLPRRAGLVPFTFTDYFKKLSTALSGISVPAIVTTGKISFEESILFTHRGLSGPAALQVSSYWQAGETIFIDLLPEETRDFLLRAKARSPKQYLKNVLCKRLPNKLVEQLEPLQWPQYVNRPLADMPNKALENITQNLFSWSLKPAGTEGYRTAEVTLGGVDTRDLSSKTMAAINHPNLYFIGEVVDVTGHLGGFNFQWAWASGVAAGQSVS